MANWRFIRVELLPKRGEASIIGERVCPKCNKRMEGAFHGPGIPTKVICSCGWSETLAIETRDLRELPPEQLKKLLDHF